MSLRKRLQGDLFLGYRALVAHPLRRALSRDGRTGMRRFLDNYAVEGLVPTTEEDRSVLYAASRCIHCGLCDFFDPALGRAPAAVWGGPSLLPIAWSKSSVDAPRVARGAYVALDVSLARAEAVCPTRVPLRRIAEFVRRKADEVARAAGT